MSRLSALVAASVEAVCAAGEGRGFSPEQLAGLVKEQVDMARVHLPQAFAEDVADALAAPVEDKPLAPIAGGD